MNKIFIRVVVGLFAIILVGLCWHVFFPKPQPGIGEPIKTAIEKTVQKEKCRYIDNDVALPPELLGEKVSTLRDTVVMDGVVDSEMACASRYIVIGRTYNDYDGYVNGMTEREYLVSEGIKFISVKTGSVFRIVGAFTLYDTNVSVELGPSLALYLILEDEKGLKSVTGGYYVGTKTELPENYWRTFVLQDSLDFIKN
jgi:hypothetical protein